MNKLLLLGILACLALLASSKPAPADDDPVMTNERRSPCVGGCQFLTGVKFGKNRKLSGRRKSGKYLNRFNDDRE